MRVSILAVKTDFKNDTYFCMLATLWTGGATLGVVRRPLSPFWLTRTAGRSALAREDMVNGGGDDRCGANSGIKARNWTVTKITGLGVVYNVSTVRDGFEKKRAK